MTEALFFGVLPTVFVMLILLADNLRLRRRLERILEKTLGLLAGCDLTTVDSPRKTRVISPYIEDDKEQENEV